MPTTSTRSTIKKRPSSTEAVVRRVQPDSHHHRDVAGIGFLALGVVVFLTLIAGGRGGLIGDGLVGLCLELFGKGAWLMPFVFALIGGTLILGHEQPESRRTAFGVGLVIVSILGFMARARGGDFFDVFVIKESGGIVGACVAWAFDALLGQVKAVGIGSTLMAGVILCLNTPIRSLAERFSAPKLPSRAVVKLPDAPKRNEDKKSALKEALEKMASGDVAAEEPAKTVSPKTKLAPKIHETIAAKAETTLTTGDKEGYQLPPVTVLREPAARARRSPEEMQKNIEILERTLEEFRIEANVVEIATGPTITRYEVQLGPGIKVSRITQLADNIAMNMSASDVRVEAPIPGKNAIGVEVPNGAAAMVTLRELCDTKEFQDHPSRLLVGLGQDVSGKNRFADLTKMPHLLIGGATNSGKSIGLATIITSLLMRNTPKEVRMVMIDPKRVELSLFDGVPHLMCPVVKDVKEAPGVLRAIWREMDMRYDLFSERGVRNIDGWNEKAAFNERMSYIVVIIDELADLMIQAAAEVETSIVRLAQLARAVGIHLVIATQRPSVDVITGLIKANIPSRIAFAVSSHIDSRTILDGSGAERLVGKGDMLFLPIDANKPVRIQGCYVSEKEIEAICRHWKEQEQPNYVLAPVAAPGSEREGRESAGSDDKDELWEQSVRFVVERGQASTSMLQRKFSIGFQRASRLLDMMEDHGIVGERDGPRPREVMVSPMQLEQLFTQGYVGEPAPDMDPLD